MTDFMGMTSGSDLGVFALGLVIAGGVGGPLGWRAAFAAPLALTMVIVVLARGFAPQPVIGGAGGAARAAGAGTAAPG